MKEFITNLIKGKVNAPYHFSSKFELDKNPYGEHNYHSFSAGKEAEKDYQESHKNKNKINSLLEITSKSLKLEYNQKLTYLNKNLRIILVLSILIILNSVIKLKFVDFSELNVSIIILSSISITITVLLLFNIQTNVLLDLYGFSSFYLFSIFESCILIILYILTIIDFSFTFNSLSEKNKCKGKKNYFCLNNSSYLISVFLNIFIFIGIFLLIKFTLVSFWQAFNVLVLKQKTTVQKQFEINQKSLMHADKIEFAEDDDNNINNESKNKIISEIKLDSFDNLKTE